MSLVPRSIKEFGFDHQFTLSALYLEKDNNTSFAGIYKNQDKDYFCISGGNYGFIYFPLDIINVGRLVKSEYSLLRLILNSRQDLLFSSKDLKNRFMTGSVILLKCLMKRYNKIPNAYYIWHAFLNGTHKNIK